MIVDENPRKKLYKTLISSSDPEVKQHFSQWTEDEFDKSLSTDKEFQQSLFEDLKGIGLAKDQAAFSKEYVPAMVPVGKTTTAATPAPPAKQKPVQAAPVEAKPKTLKESIGQSVTGVIDWTKGLIQKNDLFGRWTSFGADQKKREDQANKTLQTEFIPGAVTTAKKDLEIYERVKGTQIDAEEKIRQARSEMNMPLVRPDMAAEDHVQRKARLQKVIDDNQVILNATSKDRRQIEARTQRHVNDMISSIVEQELPEDAYVKSKTGKRIPNEIWVQDRTRELVKKYGLPDGKYAYSLLKSGLSASLLGKERLPELKSRAAKIFAQKHGGKSMEQVIGDQEASGVQQLQAINNGYKNEAATFGAQLNAEYGVKEKELLGSYRSAQASLDKKIAEDVEIKQFVDRLDQDMRAPLQVLVNDNKISADEANKMLTSKESADKRKTLILEQIDKKYGVELAANYNTYLDGVSEINTKKKNRYERQMAEKNRMYQQAFESKKKELLAANKKFSPQLIKEIGQAYDEAAKQIDKEEKTMLANSDMEANIFAQTYNGLMKGIGQGLEATAFAIGARNLSDFGAIIASEHETSDLSLSGWDSYTFSKEGLTRAVNSVSITGGRMLPGMAATAAIAAATRGTTMPLLSRILLASVPQFGFETADIVGSTELEMLAKTGDVAKAKLAGERALKSQMNLALTYGFSSLPYFGEITRKLVPLGRFGKASAGARILTAATIETGEEAFLQEMPQNIFNTLIMEEKDPDLVGLWKNSTVENASKTLSEVLPITALFGGVPQAYKEGKASVNQMITAGYYAKNILKDASHPSRLAENQVQFITQLYDKKGMGFAGGMISTLLHNGSIDRARAEVLAQKLDSYERFNSVDAIKNIKNSVVKHAAFVLFDRYQEAKNTNNKEAADKALGDYNNFLMGKGAELIMLRMPDGDYQVYTYDDFNSLMNSPEFQEAASKQEKQYGGVFEVTPFAQSREALENPKLKQILEKFGAIQNSDVKEKDETEEVDKAQNVVSDEEIEAAQKRTGFKMPQFNELVPAEVAAVLDAVRSGEKDLTSDEISGASAYLYDLYKIYNNMQKSSTRNLTIDQITGLSQQFADALNDISNYKRSIAFAPGEAPEETAPPAPTQQQRVPIEQQVQDDIANKRFANATFDSEDQVPDELKPYLPRAVRFTQDGKQKIQITAPATLIQGPSATTQAAPVEEVSPTTKTAPVEETAPVTQTEQAPPAEQQPAPAEEAAPVAPAAPAKEVGVGGIIYGHEDIVGNKGLGDVRSQLPEENSGVIIANGKDGNQYAVAFSRKGGDRQNIFEQTPAARPGHIYTSVKIDDPSNAQEVEQAKKQAEAALQNILPTVKNGNIKASDIKDAMASFQSTKPSEAPAAQTTKPSEAPAAEAPQATAQEGQLKGKVKLFTDDDAINSFNQEQTETYERLIFMGQDAIAKQMVDAQKQAMVAKEIEQVERGEISDKVREFYKKFGIGIETLSTEDFVRVLRENGAAAERSQEAVFDDVNGKIYINKDVFDLGFGTTVVWHDSVHPIMNIIHNSNKPLYDKIHKAIEAGIKANPNGGLANVKTWVDRIYTDAAGYNDASRKDELIVEVIGRLASGRLSFNEIQPNLRQRLMDLINRIGRILGVSKAEVSDMGALKDLAKKIAAEINKAGKGDLSKIVGAENVGKFQRPEGLATQARANEVFEGILQQLGISLGVINPKTGTSKVTNFDIAKAMNQYYKQKFKAIPVGNFGPKALDIVSEYAADEIIFGIQRFGNGSGRGWYTVDYAKALNTLGTIDPDIVNNPEIKEIATVVIAIASNSTDVYTNLKRVLYAVDVYKKTGKIPTDVGVGKGMSSIAKSVSVYNNLLDLFGSVKDLKEFMQTVRPVSESKKALIEKAGVKAWGKVKSAGYGTDPEWNDTETLPTSVILFGPKIGAFYSNLSGLGGTPTIDRWCIRTMYRYMGDMKAKVLPSEIEAFVKANNMEGQSKGSVIATIEAHAKMFNAILTRKGEFEGIPKQQRNEMLKPYRKGSQIWAKMTGVVNEIEDGLTAAITNKAEYARNFRSFTKKAFERVQEKIKEKTGEDLEISDIQAILWIYEKELFGALGVKQKPESTYSASATRLINEIKSGKYTEEQLKSGAISEEDIVDEEDMVEEEGAMGDLYGIDPDAYKAGLDEQPERLNENVKKLQPSLGGREKQGKFEPEKKDEESKLRSERAGDRGGRPESRETAPLEGAPSVPGVNGPDPQLVAVAERYAKANGIPLKRQSEYVKVDVNRAKRIAEAYAEMKHDPQNPKVKEAYKELIKQTVAQYEALAEDGYKFWFIDTNIPSNKEYAETPFNALRDIRKNKEMGVFPTTDGFGSSDLDVSDNPLMEETKYKWPVGGMDGELKPVLANDLFRAVHDAFGHGLEGAAFRARGEENAWQAHIRLFTGAAQGAITSETRGQNSWLNFNSNILKDVVGAEKAKELHPDNWETITVGEHNRNAKTDDTIFADQKTGLMPEWTWTEGRAGDMQEGGTQASLGGRQAEEINDIIETSKKEGTYLKAPNGKKTNLNEFQWAQVRTNAFKKWFGDWESDPKNSSKVVDDNGEPKVVYHGTDSIKDFDQFWTDNELGAHFGELNQAEHIIKYQGKFSQNSSRIYPVFLKITNPIRLQDFGRFDSETSGAQLVDMGLMESEAFEELNYMDQKSGQKKVASIIQKAGYDGVVYLNRREGVDTEKYGRDIEEKLNEVSDSQAKKLVPELEDSFISFSPNQIKSATANTGGFSLTDARIQFSLGGRQAAPSFADLDKILDMPPAKSRAAREKLIDQYGKETVDRMIEISRNFTKIINGLEEQGVVEKDCP